MTNPKLLQEFVDQYVVTLGVSADGRYVYGSVGADLPVGIYDLTIDGPMLILEPELNESLGVA